MADPEQPPLVGDDVLELSLAPTTAAPAQARAAVSEWLADRPHDGSSIETARLLVSELVTNSTRHAQTDTEEPLRLCGSLDETTLRLQLWDAGTDGAIAPKPPRVHDDTGGFGLHLTARLSNAWGVDRDPHGTTVWLELPTDADTA